MKQERRREKFNQLLALLNKQGVLDQSIVNNVGCPEPEKIIERLFHISNSDLSAELLAQAFAEVFDLAIYSAEYHGLPIAQDKKRNDWIYASRRLFVTNPFVSPTIRGLLSSDILATEPFEGYGILPISTQRALSVEQQLNDNECGEEAKKILMKWLTDAVNSKATDLQIIPIEQERILIKQRVDGKLYPTHEWTPKEDGIAYKHISNVILNECKQVTGTFNQLIDSSFKINGMAEDEAIEVRMAMRPIFAEGVQLPGFFLRFLSCGQTKISKIGDLKLLPETATLIQAITSMSEGLCVLTGPTGSGKTTTLYTILNEIHCLNPYKSIQTLEDPVEQNLEGIEQTQVHSVADSDGHYYGLTFEAGIRSMMRTDVDLILVGEIRDRETARQAMCAALTGHGVLTTLHTVNALGVIDRLVDLGVERGQLASWLRFVSAQRLVAKLCSHCSTEVYANSYYQQLKYTLSDNQKIRIANYDGCANCRLGYSGRCLIMEVIPIDSELQKLIHQGASGYQMRAHLQEKGQPILLEDYALKLLLCGSTTVEALSDTFGYCWGLKKKNHSVATIDNNVFVLPELKQYI